ncbi:MAG: SAM-dependent methyltransferase [Candidatus Delongbacteria bacterium]|nr:MAG: SAM-dependent methyltransferase [Candidatus Delongbacteria bacterium]
MILNFLKTKRGKDPFSITLINNYENAKLFFSKNRTNCFRIYDKEITQIPLTIDYYDGFFVINHYWKQSSTESDIEKLVKKVNSSILESFEVSQENIFHKYRKINYDKELFLNSEGISSFLTVYESGIKFEVNLKDYLDTGIFLDHSPVREIAMKLGKEKRVLNLFSYTSSFSLYVLKGGAKFCRSVDISNTYVDWSRRNHILNNIDKSLYEIRRDDCLNHLKFSNKKGEKFDFIIMDPPTFSRSKKIKKSVFNVQKDHVEMINNGTNLLSEGGVILFSNNLTTFKMDKQILKEYIVKDISEKTIPYGFKNKKIHKTFLIRKK